jgi:hypothetical protein
MTSAVGPELDGAPSLFTTQFDLASVGYCTHEHIATGTAQSYAPTGALPDDGRWEVAKHDEARYATRFVVYRPADPARANGTVVVEWLNVTGGLDIPALWMPTHRHLVREGFTWVGVTAQVVGIEGGGMMPGLGLRDSAPDRYGMLVHPGDRYSFDMFTQVARAVRTVLAERYGIGVEHMIATGASQSAMHLTTYVNAVDVHAQVFDAFLLQGRSGSAPSLDGWTLRPAEMAEPEARARRLKGRVHIRADARVPVLVVQSETDVFGTLAYLPARQPDSEQFRLWEVAGAAHCDTYFLCASAIDSGSLAVEELAALIARADSSGMPLEAPMNAGPQMHYVLQRAFDAVDTWVRDGVPPATAARLEASSDNDLVRDELGVGLGGVRSPWVDTPLEVYSGLGQPGDMNALFGTTSPIDHDALAKRYPGGRDDYVEQFRASTADAVASGHVLAVDAGEINALGALAWP